ncbi:calnexin-like [Anneissia japonica]|uniref:calnexin-like n=1 Tax=Anneissia japonica TaxID=1529436 RepID=UPI0014258AA7|nr:calnexin-like [Anneissia japonica]
MKMKVVTIGILLLMSSLLVSADEDVEVSTEYTAPEPAGDTHLHQAFDNTDVLGTSWIPSEAKKDGVEDEIAKYDGKWKVEEPSKQSLVGDLGLVLKSKAKHHAIATNLDKPFVFDDQPFIVQYEVKFQNDLDCGGAYIKLLSKDDSLKLNAFTDKTPYTIMFGPDKCGADSKFHFIFRHKNPKTGEFEEKHAKKPSGSFSHVFTDKKTHLFTLVVEPDNSFEMFIDQKSMNSGNLLEDVNPPVNPPEEIPDPKDSKPEDWDDRKKIPDPDATKPEDWDEDAPRKIPDPDAVKPEGWLDDEPELIPDPDSEKPEDWDDEMDGEWEAPKIKNPLCEDIGCGEWKPEMLDNPDFKGKWKAPMIDNEAYKGEWSPRMIPNPDYFQDLEPFKMTPIGALGLELWTMNNDIVFDNFIVTSSKEVADQWAADSWALKSGDESSVLSGDGMLSGLLSATEERPWLWAVYALVVIIPIFLCARFCSPSKKSDYKKTDEPTGDDEEETQDDEEEEEADKEEGDNKEETEEEKKEKPVRQRKKKASKSDLETKEDTTDGAETPKEGGDGAVRKSPRRKTAKE